MTKTNEATNEIKEALETGAQMIKANRLKLTVKLGELPNRRLVNGKGRTPINAAPTSTDSFGWKK
jgi:hypothetical protein